MSVIVYSKAMDGARHITPHFEVREFSCHDGSDKILVDTNLVHVLEQIRAHWAGCVISINSAYRTTAYNSSISGAPHSQHLYGKAADIVVTVNGVQIKPALVAAYAEHLGIGGIGLYPKFTHVDVRAIRSRWEEVTNLNGVVTFLPNPELKDGQCISMGAMGDKVMWIQAHLVKHGAKIEINGKFGATTDTAVDNFQRTHGLIVDGLVGEKTIAKLQTNA
jgi:hypothetical protein